MNYMLIITAGIFLYYAMSGMRKGLLKIAISFLSMVISVTACFLFTPVLCDFIKDNTQVYDKLNKTIYEIIENKGLVDDVDIDYVELMSELNGIGDIDESAYVENANQLDAYKAMAQEYGIPKELLDKINVNQLKDSVADITEDLKNAEPGQNVTAVVIASSVSDMILKGIIYLMIFCVVFLLTKVLLIASGVITMLPIIKQANKFGGLLVGGLEGLVIISIVYSVITVLNNLGMAQEAFEMINNNAILRFIYENNLINLV